MKEINGSHPTADTHPADQPQIQWSVAMWQAFYSCLYALVVLAEVKLKISAEMAGLFQSPPLGEIIRVGMILVPLVLIARCGIYIRFALFPSVRRVI